MRTNIVLDDDLVREAMRYSDAPSKRALVEEALRNFVEMKAREHWRKTYMERVTEIREKTASIRLGRSSIDILREDREGR